MKQWIWLLPLCLKLVGSTFHKWCHKDFCPGNYILCRDNGKFQSTCPRHATAMVKMSSVLINIIIDKHNQYRNKFAGGLGSHPMASRMTTLQWDPELAKIADALIRQCQPTRDKCAKSPGYPHSEISYALEKYFCKTTKKETLRKQLNQWLDPTNQDHAQGLFFTNGSLKYSVNYFQVLRDRANRIGCAVIEYIQTSLVHQLLKCVYNCGVRLCKNDENPVYEYTERAAGEECTMGTNQKYPNLCSTEEPVKKCDGGPDVYSPTEHRTTQITLPHYSPSFSFPTLPENPTVKTG